MVGLMPGIVGACGFLQTLYKFCVFIKSLYLLNLNMTDE